MRLPSDTQKISLEPEKDHDRQTRQLIGELDPTKEQCYSCDRWKDRTELMIIFEDAVGGDLPTIKVCIGKCEDDDRKLRFNVSRQEIADG